MAVTALSNLSQINPKILWVIPATAVCNPIRFH